MGSPRHGGLVDALERYDRLLEVGVGDRLDVARALAARGCSVLAIDIDPPPVDDEPPGDLSVRRGDVVALAAGDSAVAGDVTVESAAGQTGVDAVYARRLPAELHRPTVEVARRLNATCLFTTLGFEEPIVPADRRTLPRQTMFVVDEKAGAGGHTR